MLKFPQVFGLEPSTEYDFRVCASNTEFWQTVTCGSPFYIETLVGTPVAEGVSATESSTNYLPFVIAAAAIGGALLIMLVVVAVFTGKRTKVGR